MSWRGYGDSMEWVEDATAPAAQQGPWWDITTPAAAGPTAEQRAAAQRQAEADFQAQVAAHPERLDASGRFLAPDSGANYMLQGMTPEEVLRTSQGIRSNGDWSEDGRTGKAYSGQQANAMLDTDWRTGPNNGGGFLGGLGNAGQGIFDGIRTNPAIMAALTAGAAPYANQGLQAMGVGANTAKTLAPLVVNAGSTIIKGGNAADALKSMGMAYIGGEAAKTDALGNLPQVAKDGIKSLISSGMDPKKAIAAFAMSQLPKGNDTYTPRTNWPEDVSVSPDYLASKRAAVDAESAYRDFDAPEIGQFDLPPVDLGAEVPDGGPAADVALDPVTIKGRRINYDYMPFGAPEMAQVELSPVDLGVAPPAATEKPATPKAGTPSIPLAKIVGMIPKGTGTAPSTGGASGAPAAATAAGAAYGYPQLANIRVQDFSSKKQRLNAKGQLLEDDDDNRLTPDVTVADRDETKENAPMLSALGLPPADTMAALFEIT